jgi:hypothetical protein
MQYLVAQLQPPVEAPLTATEMQVVRKSVVRSYHTSVESAASKAREEAVDHPGTQWAVFSIVEIFESLPPAEPKILRKKINEANEIVMAS